MADYSGRKIGQYQLLRKLGEGGMGQVYLAFQPSMQREVALKIISERGANTDEFGKRFEREVKAYALLSHAHIIKVFDYARSLNQSTAFIVMEYLRGGTLTEFIRKHHPISLHIVAKILYQVSSALDYAHSKGIIHRDLKSANVLLDESENTYISDFGLARLQQSTGITENGTPLGTAFYMSPEQWTGTSMLNHQTYIYSLGVLLWEMLTNRFPFEADTAAIAMYKHLEQPLPNIANWRSDVTSDVQAILERSMAKKLEQRYLSAMEVSSAFELALAQRTEKNSAGKHAPSITSQQHQSTITAANINNVRPKFKLSSQNKDDYLSPLAFSPNNKWLVAGCEENLVIWDLDTKSEVRRVKIFPKYGEYDSLPKNITGFRKVETLIISPTGSTAGLVVRTLVNEPKSFVINEIKLVSLPDLKIIFSKELSRTYNIPHITFSADGSLLVASDDSTQVCVWDTGSGEQIYSITGTKYSDQVVRQSNPLIMTNNVILLIGNEDSIVVRDIRKNIKLAVWQSHNAQYIRYLQLLPSGYEIISINDIGTLEWWDIRTGKVIQTYTPEPSGTDFEKTFSSFDNEVLYCVRSDFETRSQYFVDVWIMPATKITTLILPEVPDWIHLSQDGSLLFIQSSSSLATIDIHQNLQRQTHLDSLAITDAQISQDDKYLACVVDGNSIEVMSA